MNNVFQVKYKTLLGFSFFCVLTFLVTLFLPKVTAQSTIEGTPITGIVFYDTNSNGLKESGENAVVGAKVRVSGPSLPGFPATLTTDTNGEWDIDPSYRADFSVALTVPTGYMVTNLPNPKSVTTHVGITMRADFGIAPISSQNACNETCYGNSECSSGYCYLGACRNPSCPTDSSCSCTASGSQIIGMIYQDQNSNGIADGWTGNPANPSPQPGADPLFRQPLTICIAGPVNECTTTEIGKYQFGGGTLPPGIYSLTVQIPSGYGLSEPVPHPKTIVNGGIQNIGIIDGSSSQLPDIQPIQIVMSQSAQSGYIHLSSIIRNNGSIGTDATFGRYCIDTTQEACRTFTDNGGLFILPALSEGQTIGPNNSQIQGDYPMTLSSPHTIVLCTDVPPPGRVNESNEGNNCITQEYTPSSLTPTSNTLPTPSLTSPVTPTTNTSLTPTQGSAITPTSSSLPTPTLVSSLTPTSPSSPTPTTTTMLACNSSCSENNDCSSGYCFQNRCRNAACPTASDCICGGGTTSCNGQCQTNEDCESGFCENNRCRNIVCPSSLTCGCSPLIPSPTSGTPSPTSTVTPTGNITPTSGTTTPSPTSTLNACNGSCSDNSECSTGYCSGGQCRIATCTSQSDCSCTGGLSCNTTCNTNTDCASGYCFGNICRNVACPESSNCLCLSQEPTPSPTTSCVPDSFCTGSLDCGGGLNVCNAISGCQCINPTPLGGTPTPTIPVGDNTITIDINDESNPAICNSVTVTLINTTYGFSQQQTITTNTYEFSSLPNGSYQLVFGNLPPSCQITNISTTPGPQNLVLNNTVEFNIDPDQLVTITTNNTVPWFQTDMGDVRMNDITNYVPLNKNASTNPINSSLFVSQQGITVIVPGTASNNTPHRWVIHNEDTYNPSPNPRGSTAYSFYKSRALQRGIQPQQLSSCNTLGCRIENLDTGIYEINGDTTITAFSFKPGQHVTILISGNARIKTPIKVPKDECANNVCNLFIFAVKGTLTIDSGVGNINATLETTNLEGIYSAEGNIRIESEANCPTIPDRRLNIGGAIIANSLNPFSTSGSRIEMERNLCDDNREYPMLKVFTRPDFLVEITDFYKPSVGTWSEVNP